MTDTRASWVVDLDSDEQTVLSAEVACGEGRPATPGRFLVALHGLRRERRILCAGAAQAPNSNELFNVVIGRARSDLYTLTADTPLRPDPYAGIPWFSTMFGRDGILTAMLCV
ncbi:hypothetical protein SAMN05660710_01914 [Paracoccus tibetensis]|uniref:Uncharacterized protein n=1 Tax=Paracoccus tibetensis TaxID=336292 RepID=A0A1G5GSY7_9RHOB|nr:hypothetical protein SAMN05660710_01914 [Paracoccus tibetensis]